ncbi:response regulator transcription factor [Bradyrhizobium oligotrophicum S58]
MSRLTADPLASERLSRKIAEMSVRGPIFVVDDDESMRVSIRRLLRARGFSALLFDSAPAMLDHDACSDVLCIIIDINLSEASGIELRRQLSRKGFVAPVIYITGNDSHATWSAAIESDCIAYLTKPFMANALIEAVERAVTRAGGAEPSGQPYPD